MRRLVARAAAAPDVAAAYDDLATRRGPGRPYVAVNMVASVDGAIAVDGRTKDLSSEADRFVFHHLRSLADVILVGAQTVRAENYGPPRISDERQAARVARGQAPVPRIAVVSGSLDLDWSSRLFTESPTRPFVLTGRDADASAAGRVADVVATGSSRADLSEALRALGDAGVGFVLCEGGPTLNGVLAGADLIDEMCLTVAPALVGGDVGAGLLGHRRLDDLLEMDLVHAFEDHGELFLRYRRSTVRRSLDTATGGEADAAFGHGRSPGAVDAFEDVMAGVDVPMVVVTAAHGAERAGCLVGFSAQSSIDPPRYTVWLSKKNHTYSVARRADVLTVHFPAAGQRDLAARFGTETGDDVDKFAAGDWRIEEPGALVLDGVSRWFAGRVVETSDTGDHVAFLLEPVAGRSGPWAGQLGFQAVKDLDAGHDA